MPVIRFVREGRDVTCYPGENLREVALREGVEIYGLKGKLGNCGGCGQCITCFVAVEEPVTGAATLTRARLWRSGSCSNALRTGVWLVRRSFSTQ